MKLVRGNIRWLKYSMTISEINEEDRQWEGPCSQLMQNSFIFQAKIAEQVPKVINGNGIRITVENPENGKITDVIDGMTGAAVGSLGWGDPEVVEIINRAARNTFYSYPAILGNEYSEELAKFYISNSPPNAFAAALWTLSGSEANENALKIIRQYHVEKGNFNKTKFISRKTSYHGFTLGALSISSNARAEMFQEILLPQNQCLKMEACYPYRNKADNETLVQYSDRLLLELEVMILKEDPKTIGAVILETLPGTSLGTSPPTPGYLLGIRKLCTKYDILFMLDEVMCGTGRANPNGGLNCWENYLSPDEGPDIQSVGKTLGSGYVTIAGVLLSPKVRNVFIEGSGSILGSHTYSCHAFNCFVALEIQKRVKKLKLTENIFKMGNYMGELLIEKLVDTAIVGDIRGLGGFWSLELVKNSQTKEIFPLSSNMAHLLQNKCFENGLNIMGTQGCANGSGDIILLAPAFIVTKDDIEAIVHIVYMSIKDLEQELMDEGIL